MDSRRSGQFTSEKGTVTIKPPSRSLHEEQGIQLTTYGRVLFASSPGCVSAVQGCYPDRGKWREAGDNAATGPEILLSASKDESVWVWQRYPCHKCPQSAGEQAIESWKGPNIPTLSNATHLAGC